MEPPVDNTSSESSESTLDESSVLASENLTSDVLEDLRGTRDGLLGIASGVGDDTDIGVDTDQTDPDASRFKALTVDDARLYLLNRAIERYPDAPSNYVMRGELLLASSDIEGARHDFEMAIELAETRAESANWGYINRALVDRARERLRQCQ